ncbi:MAG: hybrid sensory histidine kinase BarA [Methanoregula sp. PtaU1.Bin006]|nr:MAG: hybrid sensory histidine kinase BarA [Methanoregula sp. PtaB.Bin085]OPY34778.1 MAG: hybrid sensory histidine kinase BarA [Methanoregula sp. PtaU1.Bin006]
MFLILLVVCGFLLYSVYTGIEEKTIAQVNHEQMVHAGQAAEGIGNFFDTYNNSLSFLAGNEHIIFLDPDGRELMRDFYDSHAGEISSITRVDEHGIIAYTYPVESATGTDISSQSHVREVIESRAVVISDVFTSVQGFRTVAFHMPVFGNGTFRGSIAILIPFDALAKDNLGPIRVIDSGYAWAVSRNGVVLFYPDPGQIGKNVLDMYHDSPTFSAMARGAMSGSRGMSSYTVSADPARQLPARKFQAVYMPVTLGNTSWSVIVSTPEDEILGTIVGFRNDLTLISALLILSLLFFTYYIARARGIIREEEKRRKAEEALRESEEFNRGLVENLPDIIAIYDRDGIVRFANKAGLQILGSDAAEVIGKPILSFVTDRQRDELRKKMAERLSGAPLQPYEVEISTGGEPRTALLQAVPITYKNEPAVLVLMTDITERKKTEQILLEAHRDLERKVAERTRELSEANLHLQELDRLKSLFIASMSHELRTPLNSIIGFTGIMAKGLAGEINAEQKKQLGMVQDSARHLLALINDVIDISKIEADKIEAGISTFDLADVILDVKTTYAPAAQERGLVLAMEYSGSVTVTSDQRRIKQIVMNLVSNAIKFTDEGRIDVTVEQRGSMVEIAVRDTGIGIGTEELEQLFRPFGRITMPGRLAEGTGLGLYLSRKLARFLGGDIKVESEPGRGSVFVFAFPAIYHEQEKP